MEFIDKKKRKLEGEAILLEALEEFNGIYKKDLYKSFKNPLKQRFIELLLKEQNNRCCYCMRNFDINKDFISLEHLIPQSVDNRTKFIKYINPNTVLNENNVCLEDEFIKNKNSKTPPFPHTMAYQNLTASCSGKYSSSQKNSFHCNFFRKEKDIKPIVLYDTINGDIKYNELGDGSVFWEKETEDIPTVVVLGLNDDTLKMIRRIWFYAAEKHIDLLSLDNTKRNEFLYQLYPEDNENDFEMLCNFFNDTYWDILKKYDYFAFYKMKKFAKQLVNLKEKEIDDLINSIHLKLD